MSDYSCLRDLNIIYIEVTNKCNMACKYCYAVQRYLPGQMMNVSLFKRIIKISAQYSRQEHMSIIFHGGEPLLAAPEYFEECLSFAKDVFTKVGKTIDFGIQSNLVLLGDKMIDVLKRFDVVVSTSIDGPREIHNKARQGWEHTVESFRRLKDAGVQTHFIAVCSRHNIEDIESVFKMARDFGSTSLQLNIASSTQQLDPSSPYPSLKTEEIIGIYKDCIRCTLKYGIIERKLELMVRHFISEEDERMYLLCCDSPFCHAGVHMLVFTPDGTIYPCSPAVPLALSKEDFSMGNINEELNKDRFLDSLSKFHGAGRLYSDECIGCPAAKICDFGCPAFDRIDPVTAKSHCSATKSIYKLFNEMPTEQLKKCINEPDINR